MQPKTLLVLALVTFALGAFIFFYEKDLPSTDERAELAKKVLRLEDEDVETLLIEWDDQSVQLERQRPSTGGYDGADNAGADGVEDGGVSLGSSDGWRIASPLDARADRAAVDSLVDSLAGLESSRALEDFDRSELGLDEPRAKVTVTSGRGQSVLEIGAELPASGDMVVAVAGGNKAYQVASDLLDELTKAPGDWRDKKLFNGLRNDIERLSWALPKGEDSSAASDVAGEKILLAKRGDDFWVESPLTDRADEEQVNTLLAELTSLEVETFLDEPVLLTPEGMGLEPPQGVLEVVLAGQETPFRVELGAAAGDEGVVYGRVDSQLFEVKTLLPESLATPAAEWRSKAWTALQVFKIEAARFDDAEGALEVRRDGAEWQRGEDRVGYTVVSDLLYPIAEAKGAQVLDRDVAIAAGHDLERSSLSITLSTGDGDEQLAEELSLFPAIDGFAAATSGGRDAVLLLGEAAAGEILEKLQALRTAEPLPGEGEEADEAEAGEAEPGE